MKQLVRGLLWLTGIALSAANFTVCAETEQIDLKALAKKARPAVMLLVISDANGKEIATGTGFLVSADGKLITNFHVIEKAASAVAKSENGGKFEVEGVLASDPKNDLVLLKIKAKDLPFLTLGKSENIEVGTRIAAIGSPLGLEGTLSEGIVSAVRELPDEQSLLQITAAISPGSSGSPILNVKGEVIGVARMLLRGGQSLNFAIPIEVAAKLVTVIGRSAKSKTFADLGGAFDDSILTDPQTKAFILATDSQKYPNALKHATNLCQKYPGNPWGGYALALALSNLKFYDDSERGFRNVILLEPDFALGWMGLAHVCNAQGKEDDRNYASRQLSGLKPKGQEIMGNELARIGAITFLNGQIASNPRNAKTYLMRATCRALRDDLDGAITDCDQAIERDPRIVAAWLKRGFYRGRNGDQIGGVADINHAMKLAPPTADVYNKRACVYYYNGSYDAAIVDANRALELDPNYSWAYGTRGWAALAKGHLEKAASDCRKALEILEQLKVDNVTVLYNSGLLHYVAKEYTEAIADWEKAIELCPVARRDLLPWVIKARENVKK
jgi:tetratricopeptide (TPR) repeat protein